jgi:repressor LexA
VTELTDKQRSVLEFINTFASNNGFPPTRAEIAGHFGYKSQHSAEVHLIALQAKGRIELVPKSSRGIRVIAP